MTPTDDELASIAKNFSDFALDVSGSSPIYSHIGTWVAQYDDVLGLVAELPPQKRRAESLFAAVHYMILNGTSHPLAQIYEAPEARGALEKAGPEFVDFCRDYSDDLAEIMADRNVQTNEVNRCVGLLPALMAVHRNSRRPLALIDLGASAGFNLLFDRFRYDYGGGPVIGPPGASVRLSSQLQGRVPKLDPSAPPVEYRIGLDIDPIDVADDDEELWLRACLWVGEVAREQRLTAALELARREWPEVEKGDAVAKLGELAEDVPDELELCVFNSWMMGWMPPDQRSALADAVEELAKLRSVWWITYEDPNRVPELPAPENVSPDTCVLGLQHLTHLGADRTVLAKIHHHGAWLDWLDPDTAAW